VYIVGGLYGNSFALEKLENLVRANSDKSSASSRQPLVVFNGDFNWFNGTTIEGFLEINSRIRALEAEGRALVSAGNVEVELSSHWNHNDETAGCGCGYPMYVRDDVVNRSNEIMRNMHGVVRNSLQSSKCQPVTDILQWMRTLPLYLRLQIGGVHVAVLHGDGYSLAGWGLAVESMYPVDKQLQCALNIESGRLPNITRPADIDDMFNKMKVDCIACTHTCLPYVQDFRSSKSETSRIVINNGSAGMPNFSDESYSTCGVVTRIRTLSSCEETPDLGADVLYKVVVGDALVEAIALRYDHDKWVGHFKTEHPENSPAYDSYYRRISVGTSFSIAQANRLGLGHNH